MAEKLPYIISADAEHLITQWGVRKNLRTPDKAFFEDFQAGLVEQIKAAGDDFYPDILPHGDLAHGLQSLIFNHSRGDAVALDRAYVGDDFARHFEVTRAVGPSFESIGTRRRPNAPQISDQLDYIVANSGSELTLVDDVIFSGDAIIDAADMFSRRGATVSTVLAAVAIGEGREKIEKAGIEVVSVVDYEDVKDEICERDFMAGIPYSGRTVYMPDDAHYSAPYFQPFGSPEQWASIEDQAAARKMSAYCIDRSIELWSIIDSLNEVQLPHGEIPRPLELGAGSESIVAYLERRKQSIA